MRCAKENVKPFLVKAQSLELMGDYFAYVIVSWVGKSAKTRNSAVGL